MIMTTKLSSRASQLIARTLPEQTLLRALLIFAAQNPGFEAANYFGSGDYKSNLACYRSDSRPVTRQLQQIRDLARRFHGIDNDSLREASRRAFSGRLSFIERDGAVGVDYCTGQYWPTEYRKAALSVLTMALEIGDRKFAAEHKAA